jgi:hypothetical protein
MTRPLPALLDELRENLEATGQRLDGFQARVAELVRRAGAAGEADVVEDMQAIDAIVQRLGRLAAVADAMAAAAPPAEVELSAASLRLLEGLARPFAAPTGDTADCELF